MEEAGAFPLSPFRRLIWRERFVESATLAVRLRHKQADRLARTRAEDLTDEQLVATVNRLDAWIKEQPAPAIHPESWLARRGNGD